MIAEDAPTAAYLRLWVVAIRQKPELGFALHLERGLERPKRQQRRLRHHFRTSKHVPGIEIARHAALMGFETVHSFRQCDLKVHHLRAAPTLVSQAGEEPDEKQEQQAERVNEYLFLHLNELLLCHCVCSDPKHARPASPMWRASN